MKINLQSLQGHLLLAHPRLADPNFAQRIILVALHEKTAGSLGLVLHHPTGKRLLEYLPKYPALAPAPVFWGGPVQAGQLSLVALNLRHTQLQIHTHITPTQACQLLGSRPTDTTIWGFAGYTGWDHQQLEDEIIAGDWIVAPATPSFLFPQHPWRAWHHAIRHWAPILAPQLPPEPPAP